MMSHTPGPWEFDMFYRRGGSLKDGGKEYPTLQIKSTSLDSEGYTSLLAESSYELGWDREAEDIANIRLMASAPELLEALKAVLLDKSLDQENSHFLSDETMKLIENAIRKAEGK